LEAAEEPKQQPDPKPEDEEEEGEYEEQYLGATQLYDSQPEDESREEYRSVPAVGSKKLLVFRIILKNGEEELNFV
jgi:hypothetical protein